MMNQKYFILIFLLSFSAIVVGQKTVTGTIVDESDIPLSGATVFEKGTSNGTAADFDGNYELTVQGDNSVLVFSFLGDKPQEITVGDQDEINVTLAQNSQSLDQVVVVGYGEQSRGDVTGAITSLEPNKEQLENSRSIEDFIQGRAAGVYVSSNSFEPGAPTSIKIRGTSSLTGNSQPLYVIDGIIVNSATEDVSDPLVGGNSYLSPQAGITGLNPRDIASVEILKDASATAIYGSRGANGVIIITTKQGETGNAKFNFSFQSRFGTIVNDIDMLGPEDYINYQNDYRAAQGFSPNYYQYSDGSYAPYQNSEDYMIANSALIKRIVPVDWSEYTYRNSLSNTYRLSVSGGSETTKYYISGGFTENEGIVPRTYARTGDFNINLVQDLNEKMKLRTKISAALSKNSASKGTDNLGGTNNNHIRNIYSAAPFFGVTSNTPDEVANADLENVFEGPLAWLKDYDDYATEFRTLANVKFDWDLTDDLSYSLNLGGDYRYKDRQVYYGTSLRRGVEVNGEAGLSELKRFRYNIDNLLEYKTKFDGGHKLDAMIGFIIDNNVLERNSITGTGFPLQDLRGDGLSNASIYQRYFLGKQEELIISGISRLNYSYKNRYIVNLNFRTDGSSNFSEGNRWGYFPSLGLAWRVENEKFLKNNDDISQLKLRAGWGLTGNQNINPYSFFASYVTPATVYANGDNSLPTTVPANLVNPDLTWEKTSQYNAGIDLGLKDDRYSFTADVYYKNIYDLLIYFPLPGSAGGFDGYPANRGSLINKGLELSVNADIIQTEDFTWNFYGNISFNRNEVGQLGSLPVQDFGTERGAGFLGNNISGGNYFKSPANIFLEGRPAAVFFGYETNGIINNAEELANAPSFGGIAPQLGDVFMVDQNGDGIVNDLDRTIIGDPNPDYNFGLGSTVNYKNWSLNVLVNGVQGNDIANANLQRTDYAEPNSNNIRPAAYFDAWTPENPNGQYPRLAYDLVTNIDFTDRLLEDASFIRLSNVSLTYQIPLKDSSVVNSADISLSGRNLALWTDYSGFDPEVESYSFDPLRVGVDRNSFPNQRTFAVSLNVGF